MTRDVSLPHPSPLTPQPFPVLRTREDTLALGRALGKLLRAGDVIALIGDLGAGKTTLTQGIAQGMGITERVTSPTFTLVQEYGQETPLFHFDPYRLERPEDVSDFGFEEYLERGGIVVVEWADKIAALLPDERLTLTLEEARKSGRGVEGENNLISDADAVPRLLRMEAAGVRYQQLVEVWMQAPEVEAMRERRVE